jgi:hypothetical protein
MSGAIPPLPNTPSWRGAELKTSTGTTLLLPFIYLGSNLSHPHRQGIEVPQGSIVCMTLFIIAIKDIANAVGRPVTTSLYVNGITIFCGSSCLNTIERRMQLAINDFINWLWRTASPLPPKPSVYTPSPSLCLRDIRLSVPSFKFLGLIFDSKLSGEPYVRQLRHKYEKGLNILWVLSGSSRGGDRTLLPRVHRSPIRYKIDYGSFINSSASKSTVLQSILQLSPSTPAASQEIAQNLETPHCATGGTCFLAVIEPVSRHILTTYRPSERVVFRPNLRYRYETNLWGSRPGGIHFQQLVNSLLGNLPGYPTDMSLSTMVSPPAYLWFAPCWSCKG